MQRFVLRTERGPLRPLWRLGYEVLTRAYAAWLRGADRRSSVYDRGGRTPVYGLSDIDLTVVVPADAGSPGLARRRVMERRERLDRLLPWLCRNVLDPPYVFEEDELADAGAPVLTGAPAYFGERCHADTIRLRENPGLYGATAGWRAVGGRKRRAPERDRDPQLQRVAAWLELQARWRWLLVTCDGALGPRGADLCVKAVVDPIRILLWLGHGERTDGRAETLERALALLPEEEAALRSALALERALPRMPEPRLPEFTRHLVRLSSRVAELMEHGVAPEGATNVRLLWGGRDELVLPPKPAFRLEGVVEDPGAAPLLPLADWRALARSSMRKKDATRPALPDETLAPLDLDPGRLSDLVAAIRAGDNGPYPALRANGILVLASRGWPRSQLRAVQCRVTDPVSFALLEGREEAGYPNVPGWSAQDTAGRAVAEHAAWLAEPGELTEGGDALAMLFTAARAALFLDSLADGAPELALTVAATARRLRERVGEAAAIDEAEERYRRFRLEDAAPPDATVAALRDLVAALPAYRR